MALGSRGNRDGGANDHSFVLSETIRDGKHGSLIRLRWSRTVFERHIYQLPGSIWHAV